MKRKIGITKLVKLAHMQPEALKRSLEPLQYEYVDFFDHKGMQGYLAKNTEGQVVIFRESEDIIHNFEDWANNAKVSGHEYEDKIYHDGYADLILGGFDKICDKLEDLNFVTGGFPKVVGIFCYKE